jgi:microcompartment protein CcmL/EutN
VRTSGFARFLRGGSEVWQHNAILWKELSTRRLGLAARIGLAILVFLLLTTIVPRGKYLVMVGGAVADVEQSLLAGKEAAGKTVVDDFLIQGVHPQLPAAIKGRVAVPQLEAVGVIETKEVASAIFAGDAAVKAAAVTLIEARNQPGGKGLVVLTGDVGAVEAAVAAGVAAVKKEGMLVGRVVIPAAHEALKRSLL